jgi:hypothetical protein
MTVHSDARQLREIHRFRGSLNDVARVQGELWMGLRAGPDDGMARP